MVGTDPVLDLAVIKLQNASGLTPVTFANSDKVNVGDQTIAIGAPLGLSGTVTNGSVSSLNRSISIASSAAPKQSSGGNGSSPFNVWNFTRTAASVRQLRPLSRYRSFRLMPRSTLATRVVRY